MQKTSKFFFKAKHFKMCSTCLYYSYFRSHESKNWTGMSHLISFLVIVFRNKTLIELWDSLKRKAQISAAGKKMNLQVRTHGSIRMHILWPFCLLRTLVHVLSHNTNKDYSSQPWTQIIPVRGKEKTAHD